MSYYEGKVYVLVSAGDYRKRIPVTEFPSDPAELAARVVAQWEATKFDRTFNDWEG